MATPGNDQDKQSDTDKQEDLWSAILNDVAMSSARNRQHVTKTLLVLGDVNSGKSTLVDRLCQISMSHPIGGKFPLSGCSLEYRFIDVQDEETEDILDRMGVWILDGVVWHSQLLPFVLTKDTIEHTSVMIVVDMSQPWGIMESLERWAAVVRKHIQSLKIPPKNLKNMEEKMVSQFQSYTDPDEPSVSVLGEGENVALPLGETTLTCNLGVPVIVVCCKSDSVLDLEKTHGYRDDHLDFIQQSVRKFCLNYGAALFYVSSKEDKNVSLLHKYLIHRAYSLPFKTGAGVVDKDAVFIPSGWDNEKKISILYEHIKEFSPDDPYENVIMAPKTSQPETHVGQLAAEDDQVFLMAQQAHLVRSPKPAGGPPPPAKDKASPSVQRPSHSPRSSMAATTPEGGEGKATNETVLASFFNSLLSSKKQTGVRGSSSARTRNEAAAELERLHSKKS